jgi:transcriptional regulator with XRE-family HTH domain
LGEHLKRRRLDLSLTQKKAAEAIGAHFKSYDNWEKDKHEPEFRYWPGLIGFLGYDPNPEPQTLGERIKAKRRREGLTLREAAARLGIDPGTFETWEKGEVRKRFPRFVRLFEEFVEGV